MLWHTFIHFEDSLLGAEIDVAMDMANLAKWEENTEQHVIHSIPIRSISHFALLGTYVCMHACMYVCMLPHSFLDDDDQNLIVIRTSSTCYLIAAESEDYGNNIIDCIEKALETVFTQVWYGIVC